MSRVRGLLTQSGEWQCDCAPRLPAIWLEVKKNNQNKGRHFYTCQKPQDERCGFFLWDTDADKREIAQFGETLIATRKRNDEGTTIITVAPPIREVQEQPVVAEGVAPPPSKQPPPTPAAPRLYPILPSADDDGFEDFDTPVKPRPQTRGKPVVEEDELYDWEDSDEDMVYKKNILSNINQSSKRPHFEIDFDHMEDLEYTSPPSSPAFKKPHTVTTTSRTLADPFTTPPKQVTSTPHTPPETRLVKQSPGNNLLPLSYSLLHQLHGHANTLGAPLWQSLREHLLRCGRIADGAVKGRDAARAANRKKEIRIEELERRVRILEAEREVNRAVIGALKRNVDVLTGKVRRTD